MSYADVAALLPLMIVSATAVFLMIAIAIRRNHKVAVTISLIGLVVMGAILGAWKAKSTTVVV